MYKDPTSSKSIAAIRESRLKWYYKNKAKQLARQKERSRENRKKLYEFKRGLQCLDCGYDFKDRPQCCDLHHRDRGAKRFAIKDAATYSWQAVLEEIEKCDPLCANCHRIRHTEDLYYVTQAGAD